MLSYWKSVIDHADAAFMRWFTGVRSHMIGFVVQTAILFGVLYFQPWFGNFGDEAKLAGAVVVSVLVSAALTWLYFLFRAPFDIHSEQAQKVEALEKSVTSLKAEKEAEDHKIAVCNLLTVLKGQAAELYSRKIAAEQFSEWKQTVDEWNEVAIAFARNEFSAEFAGRLRIVTFPQRKIAYQISDEHRDRVLALGRQIELLEHEIDLLKPYWRPLKPPQVQAIEKQLIAVRDALRARRAKSDTPAKIQP